MQISIPPIIIPPLVPPPSVSASVNHLLDQTHYYLQKFELVNARRCLFEAYLKFQLNDALMDDKKAYFYTMNGYILFLMVELKQFDELRQFTEQKAESDLETGMQAQKLLFKNEQEVAQHCLQQAALNFLKAMEVIENRVTAERATPRLFLGAVFFFAQNYRLAATFFKQAEALSLGTEGANSVLYLMASYNVVVTQMSQMVLFVNQQNLPSAERNLYNQPPLLPPLNFQLRNQRFIGTTFQQKQIELNLVESRNDYPTELFGLGKTIQIDQQHEQILFNGFKLDELFRYHPECDKKFKAEDIHGMKMQSNALGTKFRKLLGNHQYTQNCEQLQAQIAFFERELETQIKNIIKPNTVADAACPHKSKEVQALEHFKNRLGKIPQRALVQGVKTKKKKGKK